MTTSTPHADRRCAPFRAAPSARAAAFTLTEVLIASALSAFVLAGVLSAFLLIGRSGLNASAYAEMNAQLRVAVERFNQDARLATDVRWTDAWRLTLIFPAEIGPEVVYAFEPAADPAAPGRFIRQAGTADPETLVASVSPDFAFARHRLPVDPTEVAPVAKNDLETKLLSVRLRAVRVGAGAPAASQLATSASCVLRNKFTGL